LVDAISVPFVPGGYFAFSTAMQIYSAKDKVIKYPRRTQKSYIMLLRRMSRVLLKRSWGRKISIQRQLSVWVMGKAKTN